MYALIQYSIIVIEQTLSRIAEIMQWLCALDAAWDYMKKVKLSISMVLGLAS